LRPDRGMARQAASIRLFRVIARTDLEADPAERGGGSAWRAWIGRRHVAIVTLLAVAYGAVGLILIRRVSLWGDEAFTAQMVRLRWSKLLTEVQHIDINMAGYYFVTKVVTSFAGVGEAGVRLTSLIAAAGAIVVVASLTRRLFGPLAAVVAAASLAVNPFFLKIGLTARPYALLTLLVGLSLMVYVRALRRETMGSWVLLALLDVAMLYVHLLAALFIVVQAIFYLAAARRIGRPQLVAAAVVIVGTLPAMFFLVPGNTLGWIPPFTLVGAARLVSRVNGGFPLSPVLVLLVLIGLLVRPTVLVHVEAVPPTRVRYLVPAFVALPLVGVLLLLPVQSLFVDEYFAAFLLPAAVLVGGTVSAARREWLTGLAALALLAAGVVGIARAWQQPAIINQDWRAMTQLLDAEVRPGDAVSFPNSFYRVAAEYYARAGAPWQQARPVLPADAWGSQPPRRYDTLKRLGTLTSAQAIRAGLDGQSRVWLVGPKDAQMALVQTALADSGWREVEVQRVPGLVVAQFARPS
jgi:mannosyltransferase